LRRYDKDLIASKAREEWLTKDLAALKTKTAEQTAELTDEVAKVPKLTQQLNESTVGPYNRSL
jgi:hypothetical protein